MRLVHTAAEPQAEFQICDRTILKMPCWTSTLPIYIKWEYQCKFYDSKLKYGFCWVYSVCESKQRNKPQHLIDWFWIKFICFVIFHFISFQCEIMRDATFHKRQSKQSSLVHGRNWPYDIQQLQKQQLHDSLSVQHIRIHLDITIMECHQGHLLLTWINFNPHMNK